MTITISIDDVNPQPGWRILGDPTEKWMRSLNEEFGCKFTLFVPSNYHGEYPISEHKEWVEELASINWIEIAAHGHYHQTSDPNRFGECEFAEIDTVPGGLKRMWEMWAEWYECEYIPSGWRSPGWLCSKESMECIQNGYGLKMISGDNIEFRLKYAAIHYEHNRGLQWKIPTLYGHDGIQQENIGIHNVSDKYPEGMIMYTSHIAGSWNHNVWNKTNYEQLRLSLSHLVEQYQCEFKTLNECV